MLAGKATGLSFRLGRWNCRLWKFGFEIESRGHGRVFFFPWSPYERAKRWEKFCWWVVGILPKRVVYFAFVSVYGADGDGPDEHFVNKSEWYVKKHDLKG